MTPSPTSTARDGWLLCRDLLFTSKITGTAGLLGSAVRVIGSAAAVRQRLDAGDQPPRLILVDLAAGELADPGLLRELAQRVPESYRIAFGSHVDTAALERAVEAGCHEVLPRSKFVKILPELIRRHLIAEAP